MLEYSPSCDGPQFNNLEEEVLYLRKEHARLQALVMYWKNLCDKMIARVKQLLDFLNWQKKLFALPSEVMSDAQKIVASLVPEIEKQARKREKSDSARADGLTRIYQEPFAAGSGKSKDRIGATLKQLNEIGLVEYRAERIYDREDKQAKTVLYMASTQKLKTLEVTPVEPRNNGYNQKNFVCKACHSQNTMTRMVIEVTCRDCGTITLLDPSKKEDKAFIVDNEIAQTWKEWYEDVDTRGLEAVEIEDMETGSVPIVEVITVPLPVIPVKVIPKCKNWSCLSGPNRTQKKFTGYYCPVHRGYINEEGKPI